jgi:FixJ family two-component response regulator
MSQANARVFIVDDDALVLSGLARLIRAAGHSVECFDSAEGLLDRTDLVDFPTCLLLDLQMPGMNGLDLQRRLQRRMPIVFLTGHGDISSSVDAMKAGAVDFLPKPVCEASLLAVLDRALKVAVEEFNKRREREEIEQRVGHLTPREREVMALVVTGRLNKQVASDLGASEKTIKIHRARVFEKMKARSITELVRLFDKIHLRDAE